MKFTKKIRYALSALEVLESSYRDRYPIRASDIAKRKNIPLSFLEQLLLKLKKQGLIESVRGPKGGYFLSKRASQIYLGEVVRAVEGPIQLVDCSFLCQLHLSCSTKKLAEKLSNHIATFLDNMTLEEICQ